MGWGGPWGSILSAENKPQARVLPPPPQESKDIPLLGPPRLLSIED